MKKKVLVVDLDGTLFKINTFHYFIIYLFLNAIKTFNVIQLVKIKLILFSRFLRIISHAKMKYDILRLISFMPSSFYEKFVRNISHKKRNILTIQEAYDIKILATAAPSCYAEIIAIEEKFDKCIATNFPNSSFNKWFENSKEVKKDNIMNFLAKKNIKEIDMLITDHIDDLPLMKISRSNKIINPNYKLKTQLRKHQIAFDVI